jgi:ABC-2 type transport system ATP-binding protein
VRRWSTTPGSTASAQPRRPRGASSCSASWTSTGCGSASRSPCPEDSGAGWTSPSTGLDPQARANLWHHIRALREERGTTVFLTTHYLDEADALCDRILVIDSGRIVASGTPDELKSQLGGDVLTVTVEHVGDVGRVAALMGALPGADAAQVGDTRVVGRVPHRGAALVGLVRELDAAGISVGGIESRRPSLDDVFLSLTGRSLRESGAPTATPTAEQPQDTAR